MNYAAIVLDLVRAFPDRISIKYLPRILSGSLGTRVSWSLEDQRRLRRFSVLGSRTKADDSLIRGAVWDLIHDDLVGFGPGGLLREGRALLALSPDKLAPKGLPGNPSRVSTHKGVTTGSGVPTLKAARAQARLGANHLADCVSTSRLGHRQAEVQCVEEIQPARDGGSAQNPVEIKRTAAEIPLALTAHERHLLRTHRRFYEGLASGEVAPNTEAQRRFLEVARGTLAPVSPHETAFFKFSRLVQAIIEEPQDELQPPQNPYSPNFPDEQSGRTKSRKRKGIAIGPASLTEVLGFDPYTEEPPRVYDPSHPSDEESAGPSAGWYSREDYRKFHSRYP